MSDNKLKADRPHPCNYPHMPTDYRQTSQTDGWTDRGTERHYQVHYLPATLSIKMQRNLDITIFSLFLYDFRLCYRFCLATRADLIMEMNVDCSNRIASIILQVNI